MLESMVYSDTLNFRGESPVSPTIWAVKCDKANGDSNMSHSCDRILIMVDCIQFAGNVWQKGEVYLKAQTRVG